VRSPEHGCTRNAGRKNIDDLAHCLVKTHLVSVIANETMMIGVVA
jgi:hypothetical protein